MKFFWITLFLTASSLRALPPEAEALRPEIKKLDEAYRLAGQAQMDLRKLIQPHLAEIDRLKEQQEKDSRWWRQWWLKRKLSQMRVDLEELQAVETAWRESKKRLFHLTSAVVEVVNASLENGFRQNAGPLSAKEKEILRKLIAEKEIWSRRLDRLGFTDEHPFELVPRPARQAMSRLYLEDQVSALKARRFQLEAWKSLLEREISLYQFEGKAEVLDRKIIGQKTDNLRLLRQKVARELRACEKDLSSMGNRLLSMRAP